AEFTRRNELTPPRRWCLFDMLQWSRRVHSAECAVGGGHSPGPGRSFNGAAEFTRRNAQATTIPQLVTCLASMEPPSSLGGMRASIWFPCASGISFNGAAEFTRRNVGGLGT